MNRTERKSCKEVSEAELKIKVVGKVYEVLLMLMLVLGLGAFFLPYLGGIKVDI